MWSFYCNSNVRLQRTSFSAILTRSLIIKMILNIIDCNSRQPDATTNYINIQISHMIQGK